MLPGTFEYWTKYQRYLNANVKIPESKYMRCISFPLSKLAENSMEGVNNLQVR
jgi:hypothetical protein